MAQRLAAAREPRGAVGQVAEVLLLADRQAEVGQRAAAVHALAALGREQRHDVVALAQQRDALAEALDDARRPRGRAPSARSPRGRRPRRCTGRCGRRRRRPAARAPRRAAARPARPPARPAARRTPRAPPRASSSADHAPSHGHARASRRSSPDNVWLVAPRISTSTSSPALDRPLKFTTLL